MADADCSITETSSELPTRYRTLRVQEIVAESHDSCSIIFAAPSDDQAFAYRPGQFLTLRIPLESGQVARCYSLASAPALGESLKVTVKRVNRGVASNWICDHLHVGDMLEVMPPAGVFTPRQLDRDFIFFAGGSGITPIVSIIKSALHEGSGQIILFYANRDERSIIFASELRTLARNYPDRLMIYHWLTSVQDIPTIAELAALARPFTGFEAFICGPEPFMDCAAAALSSLGFDRKQVHIERFVSLSNDPGVIVETEVRGDPTEPGSQLDVEFDGATLTVDWQRDRTLLDAMLGAGLPAPFSCLEGKCSACACRVLDGQVTMRQNDVLDAADLAEGWVLACQALPETSTVRVTLDN